MNNKPIEEFYLSASEYCKLVEYTSGIVKQEFVLKAQKLLSLVYLKASLFEIHETEYEGELEKFVQEEEWIFIKNNVAKILGRSDRFIELVLPEQVVPENYENIRLSEAFADIYQDLKDFSVCYNVGKSEVVEAAIVECLYNFEKIWGQRLLSALTYLHNYRYSSELFDEDEFTNDFKQDVDTDTTDWIINNRFED